MGMTLNLKIILVIIVFTLLFCKKANFEMFGNYKAECNYLPRAIQAALDERKMKNVKDESWEYYLPCGYTYCESKVALWQLIKNEFGDKAHTVMPETFILSDRKD